MPATAPHRKRRSPLPKDIDQRVLPMVHTLNKFTGVRTQASCGGHAKSQMSECAAPKGSWYVDFQIDPDDHGWRALEFLAWIVRDSWRAGKEITLEAQSIAPWINTPGQMLFFHLIGTEEPATFATWIDKTRRTYYVAPGGEAE